MNIYIKLYENKIYLKNIKTNIEYTIIPDKPFSQNGLLIANIDIATENIKNGIKKVMTKIPFLKPKIYAQPMKDINEITQTEVLGIMQAFYKAGARELILIKNENEINP
jgi:hypothetical protein